MFYKFKSYIFLIVFIFSVLLGFNNCYAAEKFEAAKQPYVLLISIDGYRYDYTQKFKPPHISSFANKGARAESLIPVFPSKTFPNHYSIVTGRYADFHGIVSNEFWAPDLQKSYKIGEASILDPRFYKGDPLWNVAEKAGLKAASYFWVGSEIKINGSRPTYFKSYKHSTPNSVRVTQIIKWLKLPLSKRPHFLTVYFSTVDSAGHSYGPESLEVKQAVLEVDTHIDALIKGVKATGLPVNIFLVSDHGMQAIDSQKTLNITSAFKGFESTRTVGTGTLISVHEPNTNKKQKLYKKLKDFFKSDQITRKRTTPIAGVYCRHELPQSFNYRRSKRVGDIVIAANDGYYLTKSKRFLESLKSLAFKKRSTHGWDPDKNKNMHGIFYAQGPNIVPQKVYSFKNIHIYPLILKILGLSTEAPYDGQMSVLQKIYKK